jgi:hypothetical protein
MPARIRRLLLTCLLILSASPLLGSYCALTMIGEPVPTPPTPCSEVLIAGSMGGGDMGGGGGAGGSSGAGGGGGALASMGAGGAPASAAASTGAGAGPGAGGGDPGNQMDMGYDTGTCTDDSGQLDTWFRCFGLGPAACAAQCAAIGRTCAGYAYHPYSPSVGLGPLKQCKNGFPTSSCTYCYNNGDVCTFFYPGALPLCSYTGGKGCE